MKASGLYHDAASGCGFAEVAIERPIAMEPDLVAQWVDAGGAVVGSYRLRDKHDAVWLPRGRYLVRLPASAAGAAAVSCWLRQSGRAESVFSATLQAEPLPAALRECVDGVSADEPIISLPGTAPVAALSWRLGDGDWFYRHFDHASRTIGSYMLGDSELLQGRVLDVGCGDGITDLGFALHYSPELLVGIDPFNGFERLPEILQRSQVPLDAVPPSLRFLGVDGNHLPFADDSFDVVISWGSLEHIAGGHLQCMREIKRVLRNGGLFFANPGLFYSNIGHHLGEFSSEPFFHLKMPEDELKKKILEGTPEYMDRSGLQATPAEYWQWYKELNPITVESFEKELRALDFEPWRVAIRTEARIEYTPELLGYSMQDLANNELYVSCWNRKHERPAGFVQKDADSFISELRASE